MGEGNVSYTPKILAFAGSTREASYNKKLVGIAVAGARAAGADVTLIDLRNFPMPLFDGDLETSAGTPEPAQRFKALMIASDGFLISAPEYNSSITGVLKNAIDWASREAPGEAPLIAFAGKVAALMAASPGALGGLRGLVHVRAILGNIKVLILPEQVALMRAADAFDASGALKDAKQQAAVAALGAKLVAMIVKLKS